MRSRILERLGRARVCHNHRQGRQPVCAAGRSVQLALMGRIGNTGGDALRRTGQVRMLAVAFAALLVGCNDRLKIESFTVNPDGSFVYVAQTNTVMTPNDDGEAEQIRRDWLAEELREHDLCAPGYVIETRRLAPAPEQPDSNAHDIVYTGRCL
jgi:hypothetical protein